MKAELVGFIHAFGVRYERKRRVKNDYRVIGLKFKTLKLPTAGSLKWEVKW